MDGQIIAVAVSRVKQTLENSVEFRFSGWVCVGGQTPSTISISMGACDYWRKRFIATFRSLIDGSSIASNSICRQNTNTHVITQIQMDMNEALCYFFPVILSV